MLRDFYLPGEPEWLASTLKERKKMKAQTTMNFRRYAGIAAALVAIGFAGVAGAQSTSSTPTRDPAGVNPQTGRPNPDSSTGVDKNSAANTGSTASPSKVKKARKKPNCNGLTGDAMTNCARKNPQQQQIQSQDRPIGKTPN
jgi:hypothetical protein